MATIKDGKGTFALCAFDKSAELKKHEFGRPEPGPKDVAIDVKFCGMCHSDLHSCNGDWGIESFPIAPGHEVAGIVTKVGAEVKDLKVGDRVGVGCFVESCENCELCDEGLENHCPSCIQTYSSTFPKGKDKDDCAGYHTNGGYSTKITVRARFTYKIPDKLSLEAAGPLLCAGITMYSPLNRHVKGKANQKVGIVGFGGLGCVGVKIAKAMGAEVTVFSRSDKKKAAAEALGAKLLVYTDADALKAATRGFHTILDTVAAAHPIAPLVGALKVGGHYVLIGGVPQPFELSAFALLMNRHCVEGSLVGGCPETAEMLQFFADNDIQPDFKVISAKDAPAQFSAMAAGTASTQRYVIDMSTMGDM